MTWQRFGSGPTKRRQAASAPRSRSTTSPSRRRRSPASPSPTPPKSPRPSSPTPSFLPASSKLRRILKLYEEDLDSRCSPRTVETFVPAVRRLLAFLDERGIDLASVSTSDLQAYQAHLYLLRKKDGRPYSVSSQCGLLIAMKNFFRFLSRRHYVLGDPAAAVELPRQDRRLPRTILTPRETKKIIEAVQGHSPRVLRDRAMLETLYATGIRISELSNLTPYDVDTEERILRVCLGKGRKDRNVPLTRAAAQAIEAYLSQGRLHFPGASKARYLFLATRGGWLQRAVIGRIIHFWARRAGVDKNVTCHTFRHSVATHLLKGRVDIRHIQVLLGHARLSTTERYTRVELQDLKSVISRAHPRGR